MNSRPTVSAGRLHWVAVALVAALAACTFRARGPAVPEPLTARAVLPGLEQVRFYPGDDADAERFVDEVVESSARFHSGAPQAGSGAVPVEYLALSGGGDNGAFGAGLLVGWTEHGARPEFEVVTGTSTGALIAPFAFLGPRYDAELRELYTTRGREDIFSPRNFLRGALFDDAVSDTAPLEELIEGYADEQMLGEIGREWREQGRWLLVATTNLDADRQVIWNMGAIAASDHPRAPELFRKVLLASASIPGMFPPVMLDVVVDGQPYQEMHIDGGAISQTFFVHSSFAAALRARGAWRTTEGRLFVVRNASVAPTWGSVDRQTISITARAMNSLLRSQGVDDLFRIYLHAGVDDLDFNLAYIDGGFGRPRIDVFDPAYMKELFDYGYEQARAGYPWAKRPPNFVE